MNGEDQQSLSLSCQETLKTQFLCFYDIAPTAISFIIRIAHLFYGIVWLTPWFYDAVYLS